LTRAFRRREAGPRPGQEGKEASFIDAAKIEESANRESDEKKARAARQLLGGGTLRRGPDPWTRKKKKRRKPCLPAWEEKKKAVPSGNLRRDQKNREDPQLIRGGRRERVTQDRRRAHAPGKKRDDKIFTFSLKKKEGQ